ncbi:MAG: insulinase family protein, partial [Bacteroidetes bacterium]
ANAGASPENWFRNEANKKLYSNHFRRDFIPAPEKMEQVKLDAAYQIFRDRFADAGDFTFVLTGSFDVEQIKPLLATYLGSLPSAGRKESWKDVGAPIPSAMTETFRKGSEPKSQVILQFNGPFEWTPQNRFMLNNALQVLNIMMRESMREEKGGVYGVGANASSQRDPRSRYAVNITFTCSPDNAESLIQTALTDAANLVKDGPSEKNLQKIKEIQLKELEVNVQENDWWIEQLAFSYQYGGDPEALLNLKSKIEAVTAADVQAAAKRYFDPARLARMVLLPEM